MAKKQQFTEEYFRDYWLKWHNIDSKWLIENEPELIKTLGWYKKYPVTQEQHDQWYDWAIGEVKKHYKCSKENARKLFAFPYINLAPNVIESTPGKD